jgi:hypothetical protein
MESSNDEVVLSGANSAASQNYVMKAKHAVQLSLLDLKGGVGR